MPQFRNMTARPRSLKRSIRWWKNRKLIRRSASAFLNNYGATVTAVINGLTLMNKRNLAGRGKTVDGWVFPLRMSVGPVCMKTSSHAADFNRSLVLLPMMPPREPTSTPQKMLMENHCRVRRSTCYTSILTTGRQ
jgi:hypothetical protein